MNQITKLFEGHEVKVLDKNNEPWFVASDVCKILDINTSVSVNGRMRTDKHGERYFDPGLDDDEKGVATVSTPGGDQQMIIVNEPGLYNLIFKSKKKEAKPFKRWVTHEVIPTIRKHGVYATPDKMEEMLNDPDTMITVLQKLKEERAAKEQAQKQIEADRPKVVFAEALEISQDSILVKELANLLRQKGYNTGEKRLYAWLREKGYLCKKVGDMYNLPTQRALDMGLFEIKKGVRSGSNGAMRQTRTTKVTARGQIYFINKLIGSRIKAI